MDPLSAFTLVSGIGNAVGGFFGQQQQTAAENQRRADLYMQQQRQYQYNAYEANARYFLDKVRYQEQVRNNVTALQDVRQGQQRRLNEAIQGMRLRDQERNIKVRQAVGSVAARGQTGASATRNAAMIRAAGGRDKAIETQNLQGLKNTMAVEDRQAMRKFDAANRAAFTNVMFRPSFGPAPVAPRMQQGPGYGSLLMGLGGAAVDTMSTMNANAPANAGGFVGWLRGN